MDDFEPDEKRQHSDGSWYMGAWTTCHCGKEHHVYTRQPSHESARKLLWFKSIGLCRSCEAERAQQMDKCPESVPLPNGVSACRLSYAHTGRCKPWEFTDVWTKEDAGD